MQPTLCLPLQLIDHHTCTLDVSLVTAGMMTYPDLSQYNGQWVDGRRSGTGTYVYASGAVYTGNWTEGKVSACMHTHIVL